jgi:hypothetical protein
MHNLTNIKKMFPVPEIIDPVFAKTSQNARFLLSEYERFGLVFTKTRVYKFGHCCCCESITAVPYQKK